MKLVTNIHHEWALLKRFSRSEVRVMIIPVFKVYLWVPRNCVWSEGL